MAADGPLLLLVEDEPQMRGFLRASLGSHGFRLLEAAGAQEAVALATSHNPEVILLDLGLPDGDGIELARRFREWSRAPIIVLSARGGEADKVVALDAGADDYLTKPFGVAELLARVRVALRHLSVVKSDTGDSVFTCGDLKVDLANRVVTLASEEKHLTPNEYKLLSVLVKNAGKVMTHRQLLKQVWGPDSIEQAHYLRVYMNQLRQKIEPDA